jgi:hypothetical protein
MATFVTTFHQTQSSSNHVFHGWENFFYLIGSSSGALVGLMFVVITLTSRHEPQRVSRGAPVYVAPIIFHFAVVLVVSAVSEVPALPLILVGVIFGIGAITGLVYSIVTTVRLCRKGWEDPIPGWSDKTFYGFLPVLIYVALLGAAVAVWLGKAQSVFAIGGIMLGLLLLGIRNAWDLAITLAQYAPERHTRDDE